MVSCDSKYLCAVYLAIFENSILKKETQWADNLPVDYSVFRISQFQYRGDAEPHKHIFGNSLGGYHGPPY